MDPNAGLKACERCYQQDRPATTEPAETVDGTAETAAVTRPPASSGRAKRVKDKS